MRQTLLAIEAMALRRMHEFSVDSQVFKHIHSPYVSLTCVKVPQHFDLGVKSLRHVVGGVDEKTIQSGPVDSCNLKAQGLANLSWAFASTTTFSAPFAHALGVQAWCCYLAALNSSGELMATGCRGHEMKIRMDATLISSLVGVATYATHAHEHKHE